MFTTAHAQSSANFPPTQPPDGGDVTFTDLAEVLIDIINNSLIPVLIALLLVFIIWKVIDTLILHPDDEQKRADGKKVLLISVMVMTVVVAIWGIVAFIRLSIFGS